MVHPAGVVRVSWLPGRQRAGASMGAVSRPDAESDAAGSVAVVGGRAGRLASGEEEPLAGSALAVALVGAARTGP